MGRPGITEEEVFNAIEALLDREAKVTVESIRAHLQRGSPNTISRHLRAWKVKQEQDKAGNSGILLKKQKAQNLALRAELEQQQRQLQTLSQDLLTKDRTLVQLEQNLTAVKAQNEAMAQDLQQLQLEANTAKTMYTTAITEREQIVAALTISQKEQITQFSQDLQAINRESLNSVRSIGMAGQEQLLAEKLKIRDLQVEIKQLQKQIQELQQALEQTKNLQLPLQHRLKQQEQLIAHCLDPNKMEKFKQQQREMNNV
jgi:chromosome segregation ATPase